MKKVIISLVTLILATFMSSYVTAQSSVWATVKDFDKVKSSIEYQTLNNQLNFQISQPLSNSRQEKLHQVFEFSCNDCDVVDLYASMHKVPGVKKIEYGPVYETLVEPDDYSLFQHGSLPGITSDWHLDLINAQTAWQFTQGSSDVSIAVSDQNYYPNHEELVGKITYYDATNTATRTHGTAVATLIAGNTNNTIGISSIGYNSSLGLYRMNYNEMLGASYDGARVINLSWTSGCFYNPYVQEAINEVYNNGTFIIAAAGNGSTCGNAEALVYPAAHDNVFAVSSVGPNDNHERTIGNPNSTHQHNESVDIMAPGYYVPLTAAPGWYLFGSGTSYGSPIVAGTVGLILAVDPSLTNQDIEDILSQSAVNIDLLNPGYIGQMGAGRLDAGYAVTLANRWDEINTNEPEDDGNNGHGNDDGGFDPSNPGQGNGNNGNNGRRPSDSNDDVQKSNPANDIIYDMNGKVVNIETAPHGMYLVVNNGVIIRKIVK